MATLQQAILNRLAEKRRTREEAAVKEQAQKLEQERRQSVAVQMFREWLENEYSLNLDGELDIEAASENDHYIISINTINNGQVTFQWPIHLNWFQDKPIFKIIETNNHYPWHATIPNRGERLYVNYDSFIDAYIYASQCTDEQDNLKPEFGGEPRKCIYCRQAVQASDNMVMELPDNGGFAHADCFATVNDIPF